MAAKTDIMFSYLLLMQTESLRGDEQCCGWKSG